MNGSSCITAWIASVVGLASLAGCGGGVEIFPTVDADGAITMSGTDLNGLIVVFSPAVDARSGQQVSDKARVARGVISSDGTFQLYSYQEGDGATIGSFLVTVAAPNAEEPGTQSEEERRLKAVPEKYLVAATTPLKAEVTESGPNQFKFEITPR